MNDVSCDDFVGIFYPEAIDGDLLRVGTSGCTRKGIFLTDPAKRASLFI